jgi:hypothetical protein
MDVDVLKRIQIHGQRGRNGFACREGFKRIFQTSVKLGVTSIKFTDQMTFGLGERRVKL